jgi:3-oxoadipate enol-lactonase
MLVEVNGTSIYYEQEGAGPDVVLLPGLGASTHVWYAQTKGLSAVMRLTAIDLRGHGRSGKPAGPYTMRLLADDVAALLRKPGGGPAVIVGSSMASLVCVELAAAHPELVSALVLVGGFATMPEVGRERMRERARIAESEGMERLGDMVAATALGAATHQTQPALVGLFRSVLLANDPAAYAACCRAIADADVTPLLGRVRCPTLVLLGAEEQVAPLSAARMLKRGIPHAQVRVMAGAGHLPFMEQPAAFSAALQEFVASLPQE